MSENRGTEGWGEAPHPAVAAVNGNGARPHLAPQLPALTEAQRELFLQDLLSSFENGDLDAYEYTNKVHQVENAHNAVEARAAIEPPGPVRSGAQPAQTSSSGSAVQRETLDPVDIALLAAEAKRTQRSRRSNRYLMLVVMVIVVLILLIGGLWLDARVHTSTNSTNGSLGATAAGAGHLERFSQLGGSSFAPSPLSPLR